MFYCSELYHLFQGHSWDYLNQSAIFCARLFCLNCKHFLCFVFISDCSTWNESARHDSGSVARVIEDSEGRNRRFQSSGYFLTFVGTRTLQFLKERTRFYAEKGNYVYGFQSHFHIYFDLYLAFFMDGKDNKILDALNYFYRLFTTCSSYRHVGFFILWRLFKYN